MGKGEREEAILKQDKNPGYPVSAPVNVILKRPSRKDHGDSKYIGGN